MSQIKLPDWRYFLKHYLCVYQWAQDYYQRRIALVELKPLALSSEEPLIQSLKYDEALEEEVVTQPKISMKPPGKSYTPYYDMQRHKNRH
ncbi:MAG: hypothetical protein KA508_00520 [Gammaproteobacteria bacterium]|nr:hypothetical protein [Gammaproteobacteria bacterium]